MGTELQPRSPPGRTRAPRLRAAEPLLVPLGPSPAAGAEPGGSAPPGSKGCASELGLHGETLLQVPSSPFHAAPLGSAKRAAWVSSPPLQVPTSFSPSDPCEPSITRAANSLMLVYQAFLRCHRGNLSPVLGGGKSLSRLTSSKLLGEPVQENPLARPTGSPLCAQLRCCALSQQRPGSVQLHQPFCAHIPSSALSLGAPKRHLGPPGGPAPRWVQTQHPCRPTWVASGTCGSCQSEAPWRMNHAESILPKISLPEPKPEAFPPSTSEKKMGFV